MNRYGIYFLLAMGCLAAINRYDRWLDWPPASIHQWRQADGEALAWHYTRGAGFCEPRQFNLYYVNDDHAVGELPLMYWLSGQYSRHFDWPAYPLRWLGLVLMFAGLWAFGWMILTLIRSPELAVLSAWLLGTAPVAAYYGPSAMPDMPAFSLSLISAACLLRAHETQARCWLALATGAAALSVMFKLSMAILPLSLILAWFTGKKQDAGARYQGWILPSILCFAGLVLLCRWWIHDYNAQHHAFYFFADIRPLWWYGWKEIEVILHGWLTFGLPAFASAGLYLAVAVATWLSFRFRNEIPDFLRRVLVFFTLGALCYILLWFRMLREHDYYQICLLPLPALFLLTGIPVAVRRFGEPIVRRFFIICLALALPYQYWIMEKRTRTNPLPIQSSEAVARAGIPTDARVLCPEDPSPNAYLFALKRHGWTAYNFGETIVADTLRKYTGEYQLGFLALRDTSRYDELLRQYFPTQLKSEAGWHFFRH